MFGFAGRDVERSAVVPWLLVFFGRAVSLAFQGVDVYHDGVVDVFHLLECRDEASDVVALVYVQVIQSHGLEEVARACALAFTQLLQVAVQASVVFGDGHLVVVDHDDEVRVQFSCVVQSLESFAAAQRTVSDDSNDIAFFAFQVTAFGQSSGQADRGGGMADDEMVVCAFRRLGVARHVVVFFRIEISLFPSGQHLVGIALVGHVEDNLVFRRVEHVMQGDGGFHHAEVRTEMAAVVAQAVQQCFAHFSAQQVEFFQRQFFHVFRRVDVF